MPKLPKDVEMVIDETIRLVDLIYWKPETKSSLYHEKVAISSSAMDLDVVDPQDTEMGMKPIEEEDNEDTIGKSSRFKRGGRNATLQQRKEYTQYLLPGRGGSILNVSLILIPYF